MGWRCWINPSAPEAGRLYVWLGNSAYRRGRLKEGLAACSHAIQVLEKTESVRELAQAYNLQGIIYRTMGDLDKLSTPHQQSISLYESLGYTPRLENAHTAILDVCIRIPIAGMKRSAASAKAKR